MTDFAFIFAFEGMMNFSLNKRIWSLASSDSAISSEFASAGNDGFFICCCSSVDMEPILAVCDEKENKGCCLTMSV